MYVGMKYYKTTIILNYRPNGRRLLGRPIEQRIRGYTNRSIKAYVVMDDDVGLV
jgi:hypothetical protein